VSNFQAIIYVLKSLIDLGMYLTKVIKKEQYINRIEKMDDWIHKATNGELGERLKAGHEVEDVFNGRVKP
jgi:hypothetical protein